jgi:hypothetical protein
MSAVKESGNMSDNSPAGVYYDDPYREETNPRTNNKTPVSDDPFLSLAANSNQHRQYASPPPPIPSVHRVIPFR